MTIMRVKIVIQRARVGATEYRVIRPAKPLANGALFDAGDYYNMNVDREDGRRIGALWLLAARSPRSLVYLPIRAAPDSPSVELYEGSEDRPLDLVLVHHSLQFPPSRWKEVRRRVSSAKCPREVRTASVPDTDLPADDEIDHHAMNYREYKDVLRQRVHAETLILTGSAATFRQPARHFFAVAKEGPPAAAATSIYLPRGCNYHLCRSLYWPDPDPGDGQPIHLEYSPSWAR
ncbi:hypothetical protein ABZ897_29420 [Nonomuraea sp. NPDC046802]|uniref:hypothetical protein n=1 Tax=Nonomuraea sp. NPDC046802 TaxID=3154919 RepID=UPI0033D24F07